MTVVLALAGIGLLLAAPSHPARGRLAWLVGRRLPPVTRNELRRWRSSRRYGPICASVTAASLTGLLAGPVPGGLVLVIGAVGTWGCRQVAAERVIAAEQGRAAELVASLMAEHAAGATVSTALEHAADGAGRWRSSFLHASRLAAMGSSPSPALASEPLLAPLAVALALAARTGAGLSDVLDRVRTDLVTVQDCRRAVSEAVAGPRSSAVLLAVLPVIGIGMGVALGARPWHVLTGTGVGLVVLTLGVLLDLTGLAWALRLTR